MKKNRLIALLSAAAMTAALLTGCGGGSGGNPSNPGGGSGSGNQGGTPAPAGTEAVTIWYYWETEGHQVALDRVIQDYNASQDRYAVISGGNVAGALDFLTYATSEKQVKFLMSGFGYISADKTIAESQFEAGSPYQPFVEELNYAMPRGPLADWPSVSDAISLAFNKVITGTAAPADAAAEAQATIDAIVK